MCWFTAILDISYVSREGSNLAPECRRAYCFRQIHYTHAGVHTAAFCPQYTRRHGSNWLFCTAQSEKKITWQQTVIFQMKIFQVINDLYLLKNVAIDASDQYAAPFNWVFHGYHTEIVLVCTQEICTIICPPPSNKNQLRWATNPQNNFFFLIW